MKKRSEGVRKCAVGGGGGGGGEEEEEEEKQSEHIFSTYFQGGKVV